MEVIIIGAGIGGLALAHALTRAHIKVSVYERDNSSTSRFQGYSIYLNGDGVASLRQCLLRDVWESVLAMRCKPKRGINFITEQLEMVFSLPGEPSRAPVEQSGMGIDRSDLRRLLLTGLEDRVHFNKPFTRYEYGARGKVKAYFSDGSSVVGDLLVGADGAHSLVRRQLLGIDTEDTGVLAFLAKVPLTDEVKDLVRDTPLALTSCIFGPRGWSAFAGKFEYSVPSTRYDYLFWSIVAKAKKWNMVKEVNEYGKEELLDIAQAKVDRWHPIFKILAEKTDVSTVAFWPLHRGIKVEPWMNSNITLLGDAMHCMPPSIGLGANSALREAVVLADKLGHVGAGTMSPEKAMDGYVKQMMEVGFSALDNSMRVLAIAAMDNSIQQRLLIFALKLCEFLFPEKIKLYLSALIRNPNGH